MNNNINVRFIFKVLTSFKLWIFLQSIGGIVWAIDLSVRPYILKIVIDRITNAVPETVVSTLLLPLISYILLSLIVILLFRLYDFAWLRILAPMKAHISSLLTDHMMLHGISKANVVTDVMNGIPEILKIVVDKFFTQFLAACIALATVATIGFAYAYMLGVWLLCFILGSLYFTKRLENICSVSTRQRNIVLSKIFDMLNNVTTIQMFATVKFESLRLRQELDPFINADQERDKRFMIIAAFQGLTFIIYQSTCVTLLVIGFKYGIVSSGDFILLININIALIGMLRNFSNELLILSGVYNNLAHALDVALVNNNIIDVPNAILLPRVRGNIAFDNVTFSYNNNKAIFMNQSISISSGEKVGLVGYSGSGKSTFINLILRLHDVDNGKITIDGYDIRNVTLDSLRYNISIIPQDTVLFNRTVFENIRYGTNANIDAAITAATIAKAHDFIMALPEAYNTLVGESGVKLSGGQRQRIAIARAILKNSPIVILDEPTAQLDNITEAFLQESFLDLVAGKTTLVIAHRLATVVNMDRILVFDAGVIVEDGNHTQLLQRNGIYARLWENYLKQGKHF